jgi:hypothetical protein
MPSQFGTAKVVAVTAASVLGGFGIAGISGATAQAAPAGPSVPALTKTSADLSLSAAGEHAEALQTTTDSNLGAVTLVNNTSGTVDETVSQGTTAVGELTLDAGSFTAPQLLPAGTYTVATTDGSTSAALSTSTPLATSTVTVTAGVDVSDVVYTPAPPTTPPTTPPATPDSAAVFTDAVPTVPSGQDVISVRNLSTTAGAVDVYVNGTKIATDVATGSSADVTVAPGTDNVVVVATGDQPTTDPLFTGSFTVNKDTYLPLYILDDSSQSTGVSADTTPFLQGYQYTASDGGLFNYGAYPFLGSTGNITLNKPMVGGAEATDGSGYWLVASDGGIFSFGNAPFLGSLGALKLASPIVGMAATTGPNGQPGYLLVGADGGVFAFNADYNGSLGGQVLDSPVVGIAADPTTGSYTIVESDGEWFTYGSTTPNTPTTGKVTLTSSASIVGIAETPDNGGSWLVSSDGTVYPLGNAPFEGDAAKLVLNKPITSIVPSYDGLGYNLIAADGGVFSYGDAQFYGSTGNIVLNKPIVGAVNF